jgi:hypothetical protein
VGAGERTGVNEICLNGEEVSCVVCVLERIQRIRKRQKRKEKEVERERSVSVTNCCRAPAYHSIHY